MVHMAECRLPAPESGARRNFILQQGLSDPPADRCPAQYAALQFQPRILGPMFAAATYGSSPGLFWAAGVLLWWCALVPALNPFDMLYNRIPVRKLRLDPAPAPRRFAQGLAGTISAGIACSLGAGWHGAAAGLETFLLAAVTAVVFGSFCPGSFFFHLITGRARFAADTLPWGNGGLK